MCHIHRENLHQYFNSHPHKEDDNDVVSCMKDIMHFNSHPHKEDDCYFQSSISKNLYFNSHPHKEDDGMPLCAEFLDNDISTHILTRRMTVARRGFNGLYIISTHILTRRMTAILNKNNLFKITYYINNKHFISIVDIFFIFIYISKPNFPLFLVRMSQEIYVHLSFALEYQRILNIKTRLSTNMFYFIFIFFTQIIKSQTIYLFVYNVLQYIFYLSAFGCVHLTFKYRILYSLSVISAFFCNLSQPFPSCCSLSVYIICNQN